jgi:uncharacterized protein affecting Mg2+/Co2+ transport
MIKKNGFVFPYVSVAENNIWQLKRLCSRKVLITDNINTWNFHGNGDQYCSILC